MTNTNFFYHFVLSAFFSCILFEFSLATAAADDVADSQKLLVSAQQKYKDGLPKDAYSIASAWLLDANNTAVADKIIAVGFLQVAVDSIKRLQSLSALDELLESTVKIHKDNWQVLVAVAHHYTSNSHYGFIIDNKFQRGGNNGNGQRVSVEERDRVRALQLFVEAMPLVTGDGKTVSKFFLDFAQLINNNSQQFRNRSTWQLQSLTDLTTLPDYDTANVNRYHYIQSKAPVDIDGNPIYYHAPKSFELAANDGERWRWLLDEAVRYDARLAPQVLQIRARFCESQFGVQTLQSFDFFRNRYSSNDTQKTASILSLETLNENETIAQLATGIKRFTLPDDQNPIKLFRQICEVEKVGHQYRLDARGSLAQIFENRRQYPKAAEQWQAMLDEFPGETREAWQLRRNQIVQNWGSFEPNGSNVAATNAELRYVFRNGKKVTLTATEIKIDKLIDDIKTYIKSKPTQLNWNETQIQSIGNRLIYGDRNNNPNSKQEAKQVREKYLGKEVAKWSVDLTPAEKHFDTATTINFTSKPGAYLISATMEWGNTEYVVVWLDDTAIVKKQLNNAVLYFVADTVTGEPIPNANIEFFGHKIEYKNEQVANNRTRQVSTPMWSFNNFAKQTNADGFAFVEKTELLDRYNWLITATSNNDSKKRFASFGHSNNIWFSDRSDSEYNEVKAFVMTDRPVYRPKDKVQIKAWVGTAKYDLPNATEWANKTVSYEIHNPRGEKFLAKGNIKLDNYGSFVDEIELPKDAMLGSYFVNIDASRVNGAVAFRVEEYKKPEYEVTVDAPKEPVKLGDTITATIRAKYYFGSPVTEATVKYKVVRQTADEAWYPLREWDWFYGNGYGWFSYNSTWLGGWERWGCKCALPFWFPRNQAQPEIVAEAETKIKPDGTLDVVIDTSIAKEMFPDDNQRYTITAEVVDNSRRTIVGTGNVLVTKEPFKVYAWTNGGHYVPDQKIVASFQTRRLDGKPISGDADVKVFKIVYTNSDESVDVVANENEVYNDKVKFDDAGHATLNLNAGDAGQYRISCTISGQEGGYVFNVYPKSTTGANKQADVKSLWRYNTLELIPDKAEYAPNENVALRVNTERSNSFVMLFVKPVNGIAHKDNEYKPQLLRLDGNSQEVKIPVELRDMPNFFIEAVTVSDGDVVTEVKEIVVPPQQKVLNVEVKPNSETYKPGSKAKAELTVTDLDGKPIVGQLAVSIYDKSVEYISGGSNVGDIKEFFWKWRRSHYPNTETSLLKFVQKFIEHDKPSMRPLGAFGGYAVPMSAMGRAMAGTGERNKNSEGMMVVDAAEAPAAPMMLGAAVIDSAPKDARGESESLAFAADTTAGNPIVEPTVRKNFADTAYWNGAIETNNDGIAQIELDMPESLTTWKINVWSMATGTRVGYGNAEVVTRKDLLIRMQTPRFLVEKDTCVFSANVHNYLATDKDVNVSLELDGKTLVANDAKPVTTKVPQNGEKRIDWTVEAKAAGEAVVRMKALTDEESDAMEKTLPVYVHGILKQESFSNYAAPDKDSTTITFNVPTERKPEQTKLTVRFSPTLAASMVDALPYLTDYTYGCTEQTLNKFLPTAITQKILLDMNVDLNKLKELKTNLNAQELGENRKPALARQFEKVGKNPVYDVEQVRDMVTNGVERLTNMQCSDGGWGWFSGYGEHSYPHTTAVVVHGLQLAKQNDVAVDDGVISRGVEWLRRYQSKEVELLKIGSLPEEQRKGQHYKAAADANDAFIFMILADNDYIDGAMKDFLWRDRGKLSLYAVAMFGIALEKTKSETAKVAECIKILEQYLAQDDENQTAYLDLQRYNGWCWWAWYGSEYETQAYYLKLLVRTNPKNPIAPRLVKYLLNNRRHATYWNSTRDTAICIESFAEFLKATGEVSPNVTVDVVYDGEVKKTVAITPENLFTIDNTFVLEGEEVSGGAHKVELRKKGNSPLYANVYLENFTLEDPITKAGLEVKIERRIYKLVRDESATTQVAGGRGQVVEQKVEKYKREEFPSQQSEFKSGDLVEVELIVESKNDYESLLIEDLKAAGLEPTENRSGYNGNSMNAYVEYRDERTSFFVYQLPRGKHSVTYRLRAEQPGNFSALPAKIEAMYAPELKGNSDENKVKVND